MIWKTAAEKLREGQSLYLLLVIHSRGSSPGRRGFKMLAASHGPPEGSIGGGVMEISLVEEARKMLKTGALRAFAKRQVHRKASANSSGMICSGEQVVAFLPLRPEQLPLVERAARASAKDRLKLRLSPQGLELFSPGNETKQANCFFRNEKDWQYEEYLHHRAEICIIGAGHVGLATARIFDFLGFRIQLLDNRRELVQRERARNTPWNILHVNYENLGCALPQAEDLSLLIMTNRYDEDLSVLRQLLQHPCSYLGMLGSKAKVRQIFAQIRKEGFPSALLKKVHAPVGLNIGSQTPEEIAVSIAAEILLKRSKLPEPSSTTR